MPPPSFLIEIINGAISNWALLSLAIIVGSLVLEDTTVVVVGMLAADGIISVPLALFSLYLGVVLGDMGFYLLGYLASTHSRLSKYVDHAHVVFFRAWLESRYILTIFSARFIPGSRLPTYAASGFLRSPFSTFLLTAIVATSFWTTILFFLSFWFGSVTTEWIDGQRWAIALVFVTILFFVGRHNLIALRAKTNASVEALAHERQD